MKAIKEMFSEANGQISSMRIMSFVALLQAIFYSCYQMINDKPIQFDILIIWLTAGFAPKVIQKFAEKYAGGEK